MEKKPGRPPKFLTKEAVLKAQENTLSNRAAARYLHVSFPHFKRFAKLYKDEATGKSLWDLHKNQNGKGIPKFLLGRSSEPPLLDVLEGRVPIYHFTPQRLKDRILEEGLLDPECSECQFRERRVVDQKIPLILTHINGDKTDFRLDNLELLCYNCAFLYGKNPITEKQVEKMEDYMDVIKKDQIEWELDEFHLEHLKNLGLLDNKDGARGSEYISRL